MAEEYFIGIDIGSISTEVVILDAKGTVIAQAIESSGVKGKKTAEKLMERLILKYINNVKRELRIAVTGYGRNLIENADRRVTEITCHALGAKELVSETDTILDIGGQDSKAIRIDDAGRVRDFQMNDRCAAGSGRFLDVMADVLEMSLDEMNDLYFQTAEPVNINATCTVFAESEIISLLNDGVELPSIVKGVFSSIAQRSLQLLNIINPGKNLTLTGGVCKSRGLVEEIRKQFDGNVYIPPEPQIVGALGAAKLLFLHQD